MPTPFTVGVEEEFHLVDAETLALRPRAERVLPAAEAVLGDRVSSEINLSQVETATPICTTLDDVRASITRTRRTLDAAAASVGARILPSGTHPFSEWLGQVTTPKPRYVGLDDVYQQLVREQLICGCHVHVGIADPDVAVRTMDRMRPWLATLLAIGANSPLWEGVDTGYASYRTEVYARWWSTGTPTAFGSRDAYDAVVASLVAVGAVEDATKLYWDVRPSTRYATLEIRVADVQPDVDGAVLYAALARSLVRTCAAAAERGDRFDDPHPQLLAASRWRAARYGLDGELVDPCALRLVPAHDQVRALLAFLAPDLEAHGEHEEVAALVTDLLARGTGAERQRALFARTGDARQVAASLLVL